MVSNRSPTGPSLVDPRVAEVKPTRPPRLDSKARRLPRLERPSSRRSQCLPCHEGDEQRFRRRESLGPRVRLSHFATRLSYSRRRSGDGLRREWPLPVLVPPSPVRVAERRDQAPGWKPYLTPLDAGSSPLRQSQN